MFGERIGNSLGNTRGTHYTAPHRRRTHRKRIRYAQERDDNAREIRLHFETHKDGTHREIAVEHTRKHIAKPTGNVAVNAQGMNWGARGGGANSEQTF